MNEVVVDEEVLRALKANDIRVVLKRDGNRLTAAIEGVGSELITAGDTLGQAFEKLLEGRDAEALKERLSSGEHPARLTATPDSSQPGEGPRPATRVRIGPNGVPTIEAARAYPDPGDPDTVIRRMYDDYHASF